MTDEIDNELDDKKAPKAKEPDGPRAGERLAAARREQQVSVVEVAKELHLDEPKVRAIERNDFEMLGAPVFAKGHLRKYASLVGVDPDDVLQDYYQLTRAQGMPPVVGKVRKRAREISPGPWVALIIALIIAALAYWWFVARDASPALRNSQPASNMLQSDPSNDAADDEPEDTAMTDAIDVSLSQSSAPADAVVDEATTLVVDSVVDNVVAPAPTVVDDSARPAIAAGELRLSLSFSGECWTEVTDANGRRLFFDLGRAGRNVSVSGEAPLSVLFGNAGNVSVQVNGSDYEIQPADRRGQTARFTVLRP